MPLIVEAEVVAVDSVAVRAEDTLSGVGGLPEIVEARATTKKMVTKTKMLVKGPRPLGVPVAAAVAAAPEAGVVSVLAHQDPFPAEDAMTMTLMENLLAETRVVEDLVVEPVAMVAEVTAAVEAAEEAVAAHAGPLPGDRLDPILTANTTVSYSFSPSLVTSNRFTVNPNFFITVCFEEFVIELS